MKPLTLQDDIWILILANYHLSCQDIVHIAKSCRNLNRLVTGSQLIFKRLLEDSFDSALPSQFNNNWKVEFVERMNLLQRLRAALDEEATPLHLTSISTLVVGTRMESCKSFATIERILVETDSSILDMGSVLGKLTSYLLDAITEYSDINPYNTNSSLDTSRLTLAGDNLAKAFELFTLIRQSYHVPIIFLNEASINEAFRTSVLPRLEGWGRVGNGTGLPTSLSLLTSWSIVFKTFRVYSNDYFIPYSPEPSFPFTGKWVGTYFYKDNRRDFTDGPVYVNLEQNKDTGVISGKGHDKHGQFTIKGLVQDGKVDLIKRYNTHFFHLLGRHIAGLLTGYWGLPDFYGGEFLFVLKQKKKIRDANFTDFEKPTRNR